MCNRKYTVGKYTRTGIDDKLAILDKQPVTQITRSIELLILSAFIVRFQRYAKCERRMDQPGVCSTQIECRVAGIFETLWRKRYVEIQLISRRRGSKRIALFELEPPFFSAAENLIRGKCIPSPKKSNMSPAVLGRSDSFRLFVIFRIRQRCSLESTNSSNVYF